MYNLLWYSLSIVIIVPFINSWLVAKANCETYINAGNQKAFIDMPMGLQGLPVLAGTLLCLFIVGWKLALMYYVSTYLIDWFLSEVRYRLEITHYKARYYWKLFAKLAPYFFAVFLCLQLG